MDLSKLPKLSDSPPPPSPPEPEREAPTANQPTALPHRHEDLGISVGAEVWIGAVFGLIFIMLGINFAKYSLAVLTGREYHTNVTWTEGERAGTEVKYPELMGDVIWNESSLFLFGVALVLEAIVMGIAGTGVRIKRPLVALAVLIAAAATLLNLIAAGKMFSDGIMPLMSLLAVAFGGYMTIYLWKLYQQLRPFSPAAAPTR
jgi:hypothetical protein